MLRILRKLLRYESSVVKLLLLMRKDVMSKLDDLKADVEEFKAAALAEVDKLQASVKELKDKVGSGITDADLQAVIDQVDAAKKALADDVAAEEAPAPAPAPEAPVAENPTPDVPQA